MDDKQLEERLDLLKTTYDRLPSMSDVEGILKKIEDGDTSSNIKQVQKVSKWKHLSVWVVSIASIFVIGLLSAPYILQNEVYQGNKTGDKQAQIVAEKFIKNLKEQYPIEREKRRELLNLSEEEFSKIDFISNADSNYERYIDPRSNEPFFQTVIGDADARITDLLNNLILPSEMVEKIVRNEQLDKTEIIEFFNMYYSKVNSLKRYADEKLKEYNDDLSVYKEDGLYNLTSILENEQDLPLELQHLMESLQKQGLELEAIEDGLEIEFRFNQDSIQSKIGDKMDSFADGYFAFMGFEPFTYAWELIYPMEQTWFALMSMEETLLDENAYTTYGRNSTMETYYTSVFYFLVKGTRENPVFDGNGLVKEEYRKMWSQMAEVEKTTPFPYLLIPIVKEFEETGWIKSEAWDDLSYGDIEDALHLAKNGDLEQFMPERLSYAEPDTLVDDNFVQRVHALYKSFAATYDQTVLKNIKPEEIVGLYYYSAQLEDYETQYELYIKDDRYQQFPKEEFMSGAHQKNSDIRNEFTSIRFEQKSAEEGVAVLTLHPNRTIYLQDTLIGFQLIHSENGWRADFMPIQ